MPIAIPSAQKPVQLYLWSKCGFCTKQKAVFDSMNHEMRNWMMSNVKIITVHLKLIICHVKIMILHVQRSISM